MDHFSIKMVQMKFVITLSQVLYKKLKLLNFRVFSMINAGYMGPVLASLCVHLSVCVMIILMMSQLITSQMVSQMSSQMTGTYHMTSLRAWLKRFECFSPDSSLI